MLEKYTHSDIYLVGDAAIAENWKAMEPPEFGREEQIRTWAVNQVAQHSAVPAKNGAEVVLIRGEAADVASEGVVLGEGAVNLQLRSEL